MAVRAGPVGQLGDVAGLERQAEEFRVGRLTFAIRAPVGGKDKALPVRGPGEITGCAQGIIRQLAHLTALGRHDEELQIAGRDIAAPVKAEIQPVLDQGCRRPVPIPMIGQVCRCHAGCRDEGRPGQLAAVGRPGEGAQTGVEIGQFADVTAGPVKDLQRCASVAGHDKGQVTAVRRPDRGVAFTCGCRQGAVSLTISGDQPDRGLCAVRIEVVCAAHISHQHTVRCNLRIGRRFQLKHVDRLDRVWRLGPSRADGQGRND